MIILVILWTCVGIFIACALIAILALLGQVQIGPRYKAALFSSLILEVVALGVGIFSGRLNPVYLERNIRDSGETEAYEKLSGEIQAVTKRIKLNFDRGHFDQGASDLGQF